MISLSVVEWSPVLQGRERAFLVFYKHGIMPTAASGKAEIKMFGPISKKSSATGTTALIPTSLCAARSSLSVSPYRCFSVVRLPKILRKSQLNLCLFLGQLSKNINCAIHAISPTFPRCTQNPDRCENDCKYGYSLSLLYKGMQVACPSLGQTENWINKAFSAETYS